jgi:hypothetical protein
MSLPDAISKDEGFRNLVAIVVPGGISIAPYLLLATYYFPPLRKAFSEYQLLISALVLFLVIAAGHILENLGSMIEARIWDSMLEGRSKEHLTTWRKFLLLAPRHECIAHGYLRTILLRMKFELSTSIALIIAWMGTMWLDAKMVLLSPGAVTVMSSVVLGLAAYLVWESLQSAKVLADTRHIIVNNLAEAAPLDKAIENHSWSGRFDQSLQITAVLSSVAVIVTTGLVLQHLISVDLLAGWTSVVLSLAFAVTFVISKPAEFDGQRRRYAQRIALAMLLTTVLVILRMIDRGVLLSGTLFGVATLGGAIWFRLIAGKVYEVPTSDRVVATH